MTDLVDDLASFIRHSPTPYHAVALTLSRLAAVGFHRRDERDDWAAAPGERLMIVRGDGTIAAAIVGDVPAAEAGFRIVAAHTDSPNLRVKPIPDVQESGYRQVALEPYGSPLLYSWLDRDLSLAGRVVFLSDGALRTELVDFERPLLSIPSLAIHLQREIRDEGLRLNPQTHVTAILGLGDGEPLLDLVARRIRLQTGFQASSKDILGYDLIAYDTRGPERTGAEGELLCSARLDNLASCHAAINALEAAADKKSARTRVLVLYDHEEVGSRSASGAAGSFLESVLERIATGARATDGGKHAVFQRSEMISVDMAHAVHPNWLERHDRSHRPLLGGGPVLKTNASQSYATDARTGAAFTVLCRECDVPLQQFVSRSDLVCGSTIGPIVATRTGIPTVDVGNPMLAMHSCREVTAVADIDRMVRVLTRFLET